MYQIQLTNIVKKKISNCISIINVFIPQYIIHDNSRHHIKIIMFKLSKEAT